MKTPVVFAVDTNPVHRSLINYHLGLSKFINVHTFLSGEECLYRMKKNLIPDFIITDYNHNDGSGFEFLRHVKEISPSIKVIFFASFEDPAIAIKLHDAGAADYVPKSNKPDLGISELIHNIKFLAREIAMS